MIFLRLAATACVAAGATLAQAAPESRPWPAIVAAAKGQTVYWNAWGGDDRTNAFIAWAGGEVKRRYGVTVAHVKLNDTAEAVTRVVAEKSAGRDRGGSVDLIWINGPNFLAMKTQALLHGPFTQALPNYRYVDTERKRSNLIDFTVPVDGLAAPWRMAQFVYIYDSARHPLARDAEVGTGAARMGAPPSGPGHPPDGAQLPRRDLPQAGALRPGRRSRRAAVAGHGRQLRDRDRAACGAGTTSCGRACGATGASFRKAARRSASS